MKLKMMIGGVETKIPEADARYFEKNNRIIVYFLKTNQEDLQRVKENIHNPTMSFQENFIVLLMNDFQYAFNLDGYEDLLELYDNGVGVGFAFEDENGKLLNVKVPTFYK